MWSITQTVKAIQATLFVTVLYGWMIPTTLLNNIIQQYLPTSQLSSTDWSIEDGVENNSWDFITIDGTSPPALPQENLDDPQLVNASQEDQNQHQTLSSTTDSVASNSQDTIDTQSTLNMDQQVEIHSTSKTAKVVSSGRTPLKLSGHKSVLKKRKQRTRRGKCTVENPNISKKGSLTYHVPKKVVKHYSTHWKEASRLAHLSWAKNEHGDRMGIRIRAISCQSPLKYTGIRRGDVVVSINGMNVQSDKDLLKVYGRLLFWKNMKVTVKRGTRLVTLKYNIL